MSNVNHSIPEFTDWPLPVRSPALPAPGVAHLWLIDLARMGSPLQPGQPIDRNRFPALQQRTMRRFYLRMLLGAYLDQPGKDVSILRIIKGKPVLNPAMHEPVLDFSIAASGGCCLVGVTTGGVIGVDLELEGREAGNPRALARRYFSEAEQAGLEAVSAEQLPEAFLRTWACKEAVVKAAGLGIANQLCRFTVETRPDREARLLHIDDDDASAWSMRAFRVPGGHVGAVTVRCPQLELQCYQLTPRS